MGGPRTRPQMRPSRSGNSPGTWDELSLWHAIEMQPSSSCISPGARPRSTVTQSLADRAIGYRPNHRGRLLGTACLCLPAHAPGTEPAVAALLGSNLSVSPRQFARPSALSGISLSTGAVASESLRHDEFSGAGRPPSQTPPGTLNSLKIASARPEGCP